MKSQAQTKNQTRSQVFLIFFIFIHKFEGSKLKSSSNYSTPLKPVNKDSMNFEINYIDQVDIHEIESNKIFTPLSSEHKELTSEKKDPLTFLLESPKLTDEKLEKTMQTVDYL